MAQSIGSSFLNIGIMKGLCKKLSFWKLLKASLDSSNGADVLASAIGEETELCFNLDKTCWTGLAYDDRHWCYPKLHRIKVCIS